MGVGDVFGMAIAMAGLLGVFGIFTETYKRRLAHKERIAELRTGAGQAVASTDHTQIVEKLEHRIRVLERIATDKTTTLAAQIEDLREPAN